MTEYRAGTLYPGWRVLAGAFVCAALTVGFTSYIFGMFLKPVTEEFGISRANFNNGMIAYLIGGGLMAPLVGNLLDRVPARRLFALAGVVFGCTLMLISRASALWMILALIFVPLTFAAGICGALGANTVVVRWFQRRRGRALGMLALSTSIGGFISQPLTAYLIAAHGWRHALFLIGLGAVAIFLAAVFLALRGQPSPQDPGHAQEFRPARVEGGGQHAVAAERTWTHRQLLSDHNFWLLTLGLALLFGTDQAVLVSQFSFFQDIGLDMKTAALLVSVKTLSAIGGKLIVGFLSDRVNLRLLYACVAMSNVTLMGLYILQPSFWVLLASVAVFGVAVGGVFPLWATIMAWLFGARSYGKVMGASLIVMQPFAVVFLRFIGEVYDRTGSYRPAFAVFMALTLLSILLVSLVRPRAVVAQPEDAGPRADTFAAPGRAVDLALTHASR